MFFTKRKTMLFICEAIIITANKINKNTTVTCKEVVWFLNVGFSKTSRQYFTFIKQKLFVDGQDPSATFLISTVIYSYNQLLNY